MRRLFAAPARCLAFVASVGLIAVTLIPMGGPDAAASNTRQEAYTRAAEKYDVPVGLLLAVSYLETRWDTHHGEPSRSAGYGPMHLTDLTTATSGGTTSTDRRGDGSREPDSASRKAPTAALQSVNRAAELTGADAASLRTDPAANIAGGAALLAHYQKQLGAPTSSDPADWYGAVARYSGATDRGTARWFADQTYDILAEGASRTTDDGFRIVLAEQRVTPEIHWLDELSLTTTSGDETECPRSLACEWIPAPYEQYRDSDGDLDYGNHDKANRPESQRIRYIIIHDTEGAYPGVINLVQDPTYVSWQYTMRNRDGHIAQHLKRKDIGWQAGNWYVNAKSIGIEHEGYAARGTWYSEVMYRKSARLVRYLAQENDIPLDRHHILGHDNVQGILTDYISGMHWDPGPYWDWAHYFELLGAPFRPTGTKHSGMVTIEPDFETNNPGFFGCEDNPGPPAETEPPECGEWGSSAVMLRAEPRHDAPLLKDVGSNPPDGKSTLRVSDIGSRVSTGQQFAVAEVRGDWTAIWYLGQKGWFHNPPDDRNALWATGMVVTPKEGKESVPVYGRAYPEAEAYPDDIPPQPVSPLPYELKAGQQYVYGQSPETEYYRAVNYDPDVGHVVVRGEQRYYQVQIGHRVGYVQVDDVRLVPSWAGTSSS